MKFTFVLLIIVLLVGMISPVSAQDDNSSCDYQQIADDLGLLVDSLADADDPDAVLVEIETVISTAKVECTETYTDGGDFELSQSISLEDPDMGITVIVKYPDGWVAGNENGQIEFANSQYALDADEPEDGMVAGMSMGFTAEMAAMFSGAGEGTGPEELVSGFVGIFASEGGEFGNIETFEIDGKSAARVTGNTTVEGKTLNMVLVVIDEGDGFGMVIIATPDDIGQYKTLAKDIAGALEIE
jgi:hypothetical protein